MPTPKAPLSTQDALKLLDLLCGDDAFREVFATNPASALAQISEEAGNLAAACVSGGPLASKEEFEASRTQLLKYLSQSAVFYPPHCFVSGKLDEVIGLKPKPDPRG